MVIQRIQSLYLLIALVLTAIFCATPFAQIPADFSPESFSPVGVKDFPVLLVLNLAIAVLLLLSIFMFKNLKAQITATMACIVLLCASIVSCAFVVYAGVPGAAFIWTGGVILLVVAAIFALLALRGIKHDRNLLSSYDRLR